MKTSVTGIKTWHDKEIKGYDVVNTYQIPKLEVPKEDDILIHENGKTLDEVTQSKAVHQEFSSEKLPLTRSVNIFMILGTSSNGISGILYFIRKQVE